VRVARQPLARQRRRDERSGAHATLEVAFGQQLLEGDQHRHPRDPQLGRELARRGQTLAGAQPALDDRVAIAVVDLPVEGRRRGPLDRDDGQDRRGRALHAGKDNGYTRPAASGYCE